MGLVGNVLICQSGDRHDSFTQRRSGTPTLTCRCELVLTSCPNVMRVEQMTNSDEQHTPGWSRRRFLQATGLGATAAAAGGLSAGPAAAAAAGRAAAPGAAPCAPRGPPPAE